MPEAITHAPDIERLWATHIQWTKAKGEDSHSEGLRELLVRGFLAPKRKIIRANIVGVRICSPERIATGTMKRPFVNLARARLIRNVHLSPTSLRSAEQPFVITTRGFANI
jgi:hypothetical protein